VDEGVLVASVRPSKGKRSRCGQCPRRCPTYDAGSGRRRWRALDLGSVKVFVEADAPRVTCRDHGVVVASVPWARHDAGHTRAFDEQVAWLATKTSKTAVTELMRVAWRTVGSIIERVWNDTEGLFDRFADLTRIGIDEISYKKGHKGAVALGDRRACGIVGGGGTIQIASWSSSNAVASRNTGAVSTPSS
jgi:transposase